MPIQRHSHPFFGFIFTDKSFEIEKDQISTIFNWPEPESVREVQSFLAFAKFHRWFVKSFSRIAHLLIVITRRVAERTKEEIALQKEIFLMLEACKSFQEFVATFTNSPLFDHFDAKNSTKLETEASGYSIFGFLLEK